MPDGLPFTYFKVAPQNFSATVYDTDDLSITRGSSLTLLAMPGLLRAHLEAAFPDIDFDWLQGSASELVFRCAGRGEMLTLTALSEGDQSWRGRLQTVAGNISGRVTDKSLRALARQEYTKVGLTADQTMIETCAGQLLSMLSDEQLSAGQEELAISGGYIQRITDSVVDFLSTPHSGWPFDLMIFGAAHFRPSGPNLHPGDAIAALDTRLGLFRMQRLSCLVPGPEDVGAASADKAVCRYTGLYAASPDKTHWEKGNVTSESAYRRRKVGREQKKDFYTGVLAEAETAAAGTEWSGNALIDAARAAIAEAKGKVTAFAEDFEQIVSDPPESLPLSVASNMCVLNMDGNGFGTLRGGARDVAAYKRFSGYLDILKAGMLARILTWIAGTAQMRTGDVARFETLLWGGDEFTFVVPASAGWELACVIHDAVKGWVTPEGTPMTFATGLAFGPHNAPIRDLRKAAEDLANAAKGAKPEAAWQAVAYESVDRVHFSPAGYRADWLGGAVDEGQFSIPAEAAIGWPGQVEAMLGGISRSALHDLYFDHRDALKEKDADPGPLRDKIDKIAPAMPDGDLNAIKAALFPAGDHGLITFAQINLLLDYVLPGGART